MRSQFYLALSALALLGCDDDKPAAAPAAGASGAAPAQAAARAPEAREPGDLLEVGDDMPDVEAVAHTGQKVRLSQYQGNPVVVYFYPKDDTPGCTHQAEEIRDNWVSLKKTNVVVLGVSMDDNVSHRAFASKLELPFLLLSDTKGTLARAFGVPIQNGRAKRVTFVIDKQGKVAKVFPEVNPEGSADEVAAALTELEG